MIRNFIYADSVKIRSISSQVFEGISEQVVNVRSTLKQDYEEQKSPVGSGRILADILAQESSSSELKFLEDHAYTLLEQKLCDDDLVQIFDGESRGNDIDKKFVKVTARLNINDLKASADTLADFNDLGEAFWRVSNEPMAWSPSGMKIASPADARKKAGEMGLQFNERVTSAAKRILEFGFGDLIEVNMTASDVMFSAPLNRQYLRDSENMLVHKYSRRSESEFTMLGIVTQSSRQHSEEESIPDVKDADGMKEAMRNLALHLRVFERFFNAPRNNENIIDPIAIYSVL